MLSWIGLIKYMETSKDYSILGRTLTLCIPHVIRTGISAVPILMGYCFLGVCLFWRSNRFSTASGALATLWALMFGDMVYDSFYDISYIHYLYA